MTNEPQPTELAPSTGRTLAALLAAAIGCASMGILTTLAALSKPLNIFFQFYAPSGALSGEAILAVLVWLLSWLMLARLWRNASPTLSAPLLTSFLLLLTGLILTFPPFIHFVAPHTPAQNLVKPPSAQILSKPL